MHNYPDNVRPNDPLAPWNQDSFTPTHKGICFICDNDDVDLNDRDRCQSCFESEQEETL